MNKHLIPTSSITPITKASKFTLVACSAISLASMALVSPTQAATVTWSTANATTTSWALGSNWVGGVAPISGDDVIVTADGTFDPTNNSAYTGITINSLTLTGAQSLSLSSRVNVGAGGVYNNMASNNLVLNGGVDLAVDQTWGGTRTIFVAGTNAVTGAGKMRFDGSTIRFDANSSTWSAGLDIHTSVSTNQGGFAAGATMTPFGTGTVTMINARTDGVTASTPSMLLDGNSANISRATAQTLANNIVLQNTGTGTNFNILTSATSGDGRFYVLSGDITGNAANRTLSFQNNTSTADTRTTTILTGNNTYTATTQVNNLTTRPLTLQVGDGGTTGTLGSGNVSVTGNNTLAFNRSDALSVANAISGAGVVSQIGAGTTTLSGNNTYTGATTVSAGTLLINGSTSAGSAVSVAAGAALGGNGTINGNLTLANGAFLAFDSSYTLTLAGTLSLNNSFGVASLRNLNGGAIDWTGISNGTYTLMNTSFAFSDANISNFGEANALTIGGGRSAYFQNGSLQLVVIPEPSTWALLACSLTALVVFRRRRLN